MNDHIILSKKTAKYIVTTLVAFCRQAFNSDYDPRIPLEVTYQPAGAWVDRVLDPDTRVWVSNLVFFARYIAGTLAGTLSDEDLTVLDTIEGPPEE